MTRFADGPATEAFVVVHAAPEQLWPLIADPQLPVATSAELQSVEIDEPGEPLRVGSTFRGRNRRGELTWTTECTVETYEEPTAFAWVVGDPDDAVARWGFELMPSGDGTTTVRQWCRLGPGRSGLTWAIRQNPEEEERIIDRRLADLRASMQATLDAIASRI